MSIQIMMTPHVYCLWAVPVKVQIPVCLAYWLTVCKQLPSGSPVHPSAPAASDHRPCCLWSDPSQSASRSLCIQLASPALFGKPRNQIQQILDQTLEIVRQMTFIASSVFWITSSLRMCCTLCLSIRLCTMSLSPLTGTSSTSWGSALYSQSFRAWRASVNRPENSSASSSLCCLKESPHVCRVPNK